MERLRKFGLEHCDLPTMLGNVSFFLRPLTLDVDSRYKNRIPMKFYVLTFLIAAGYYYVYLLSMAWFVFCKCQETGDLVAAMIVLSLGLSSEIGPCKFIYLSFYTKVIRSIVDGYLSCDARTLKGARFTKNLLKTLRDVKKRALIFWVIIIGNGVTYFLKPFLLPGRHLMEDVFILYGLEPIFESPNYEIAYALMTCGTIFTVYPPANITAFLIVITGYTEATMLALSEELVNLWSDAQQHFQTNQIEANSSKDALVAKPYGVDTFRNELVNKYIKQRLQEIVKLQTTNINLILEIEGVFRGAIAVEFFLLMSGLITELLGGLENTWIEMPFALMQVAMDCLTGQRMMDACIKFETAVYDCKWENFNVANMRTVFLMLQNSQKTMVLSAGGITKLNFVCLMAVIRSIYSAYTTLRSAVG